MRFAVFERRLIPNNPGARCLLRLLECLCKEHEFTVFAIDFALPCPEHIRWVRIPLPTWPLLYSVGYHLCAPLYRWATSLRRLACLARRMSCRAVSPVRTAELSSFLVGSSLIVHPSLLPRSVARARGEPETQTVASVPLPSCPISAEPRHFR